MPSFFVAGTNFHGTWTRVIVPYNLGVLVAMYLDEVFPLFLDVFRRSISSVSNCKLFDIQTALFVDHTP